MTDAHRSPAKRKARLIGGVGLAIAVLIAVVAIALIIFPRATTPEAPSATRAMPHPHGHKVAEARSNATTSPAPMDAKGARDKALGDLKESQDQIARMKAQGIGDSRTR